MRPVRGIAFQLEELRQKGNDVLRISIFNKSILGLEANQDTRDLIHSLNFKFDSIPVNFVAPITALPERWDRRNVPIADMPSTTKSLALQQLLITHYCHSDGKPTQHQLTDDDLC